MNILVTGGAGYIGSHVVEELQKCGYTPIVYDNFSTGHEEAVPEEVQLVEGDIHDVRFAKHIMEQFKKYPFGYYMYFKEILHKNMKGVLFKKRLYAIKHFLLFWYLKRKK